MYIDFIDNSIFSRSDYISLAKEWNNIYSRYKQFSVEDIIRRYKYRAISGIAMYDNNNKIIGCAIYEFNNPYGSKDINMVINHFFIYPYVSKFLKGKFIKHLEKVAKAHKCACILYPDCTFDSFFKNHPDKYKLVEVTYKQRL